MRQGIAVPDPIQAFTAMAVKWIGATTPERAALESRMTSAAAKLTPEQVAAAMRVAADLAKR